MNSASTTIAATSTAPAADHRLRFWRVLITLAPSVAMVWLGVGYGFLVGVVSLVGVWAVNARLLSPAARAAMGTQIAIFGFCAAMLASVAFVDPPIEMRLDPQAIASTSRSLETAMKSRNQVDILNSLRSAERLEPVFQSVLTEHRNIEYVESVLGRGFRGMWGFQGGRERAENNRVNYATWLMALLNAQKRMAIEMLDRRDLPYTDSGVTITKLENIQQIQAHIDRVKTMVDVSRSAHEASRSALQPRPVGFLVARKIGLL